MIVKFVEALRDIVCIGLRVGWVELSKRRSFEQRAWKKRTLATSPAPTQRATKCPCSALTVDAYSLVSHVSILFPGMADEAIEMLSYDVCTPYPARTQLNLTTLCTENSRPRHPPCRGCKVTCACVCVLASAFSSLRLVLADRLLSCVTSMTNIQVCSLQ